MNNRSLGVKKNMNEVKRAVKEIFENDNVETLKAVIENGLKVEDFNFGEHSGLDAFIEYGLHCGLSEDGAVMSYLKEQVSSSIDDNDSIDISQFIKEGMSHVLNSDSDFIPISALNVDALFDSLVDRDEHREAIGALKEFLNVVSETKDNSKMQTSIKEKNENSSKLSSQDNKATKKVDKKSIKSKEEIESANVKEDTFEIIGDSNYKVSVIHAHVVLENADTCEKEPFSVQVNSVDELNSAINKKIEEFNSKNEEKLVESVIKMMKNNSDFKSDIIKMMKNAQLTMTC